MGDVVSVPAWQAGTPSADRLRRSRLARVGDGPGHLPQCVTMGGMRVDHVSYAAEPDGLLATAERLGSRIGVKPLDGGVHPGFGTRNVILPLAGHRYLEVVEVLDHPASCRAPFGQVVRSRTEVGGGWIGWVVRVSDISRVERRLGRSAAEGHRHRPDGAQLRWWQLGVKGLQADPQLPFFVEWDDTGPHPSDEADTDVTLAALQIAGDPHRVRDWLGLPPNYEPRSLSFTFVAPHGTPGLMSVTFETPEGPVVI